MTEIIPGQAVVNKAGETGTITAFDGKYITVAFPGKSSMFLADAFDKGFLRYENTDLQSKVDENKQTRAREAVTRQESAERAARERRQIQQELSKAHRRITVVSAALRLEPASITFTSVRKKDQDLICRIFAECDQNIKQLYESVKPDMEYLERTSQGRSKYCAGFLSKHCDTYVFRLFSRNDCYKKNAQKFITVTSSDTTEVLRVLQVNGKLYYFSKNLASAGQYLVNTKGNKNWHVSQLNNGIMANRIVRNCDCAYRNDYIEATDIDCLQYLKVVMPALHNNKAEIVLKHGLFQSAYRIDDLATYLEDYTPKQITVACENGALNALPFMKRYGNLEPGVLGDLEKFLRKRRDGRCLYTILQQQLARLDFDCPDLDAKVIGFLKKVQRFQPRIYEDYVNLIARQPGITIKDFFDKDYVDRHYILAQQNLVLYTPKEAEAYCRIAEELSWIDREENDYFIIVPKNITDFRQEGAAQHNCVYTNEYYQLVIQRESIIVFLRQEKDTPYVTIEYDYETFEVLQAYGKYNRDIPDPLYQYVKNLGKRLCYEMRSHQ